MELAGGSDCVGGFRDCWLGRCWLCGAVGCGDILFSHAGVPSGARRMTVLPVSFVAGKLVSEGPYERVDVAGVMFRFVFRFLEGKR